jgi:hypothetical protein
VETQRRTLSAILAIWSELPALAADRWTALEPQLQDLVHHLQEAEAEEEAARLDAALQDLLGAEAPKALKRFYQVRRQMEEAGTRGFLTLPVGPWTPIPPGTVMVCPVDPEKCERKVFRMAGQPLRCPVHNVDLVPAPVDKAGEEPSDDGEILGTPG